MVVVLEPLFLFDVPFVAPVVPPFVLLLSSPLFPASGKFSLSFTVSPLFWSPLFGKPAFVTLLFSPFCDDEELSTFTAADAFLLPFTKATVPVIAAINRTSATLIIIMVFLLL